MYWWATREEIESGKVTDVYFERAVKVLKAKGADKPVRAEFIAKNFPPGVEWGVLAGLDEALTLLNRLEVRVRSLGEGSIFHPWDPVLEIEGNYTDFALYETALLGFLCQATGVATQAARFRLAAGDRKLVSFGARRMHPAIAPVIDRSAWIGGLDAVSVVASAERLAIEPTGTMPHALILVMGGCVEATKAFAETVGDGVKVISLIDTFNDEKFEALNVAEALGDKLAAIRFDTPGSRRGDLLRIIKEVRWELDLRGFDEVGIFVSGGLGEKEVVELAPHVEGFGVGTSLSSARTVDFSMDIVEVEGKPLAKRGKRSGSKDVYGCTGCLATAVVPRGGFPRTGCNCCMGRWELLTLDEPTGPGFTEARPAAEEVRARVLKTLKKLSRNSD